jgi:hypothetical protein
MHNEACFLPGTLALGYHFVPSKPTWEFNLAKALTDSCYATYRISPSGLGPDEVNFRFSYPIGSPSAMDERRKDILASLDAPANDPTDMTNETNYLIDTSTYLNKLVTAGSNSYYLRPGT